MQQFSFKLKYAVAAVSPVSIIATGNATKQKRIANPTPVQREDILWSSQWSPSTPQVNTCNTNCSTTMHTSEDDSKQADTPV